MTAENSVMNEANTNYVGTIVGESTSQEFRLAVLHDALREQDIIAVEAELRTPSATVREQNAGAGTRQKVRIWAKVQGIERINPLFPIESGHELAATRTNPFDTVLSMSREMVTAHCQILGVEPLAGSTGGKLDHLRYPPQPATSAYRPDSADIARVVLGDLGEKKNRALDIATLSNREEVNVSVDGHAIVTRHLAILAMTGAGKSWTARRIIEELAKKNYPIVIFDPHGDYTGLADVPSLRGHAHRYFAQFPVFEEDTERVIQIVSTLGYELSPAMQGLFPAVYDVAKAFYISDNEEQQKKLDWLAGQVSQPSSVRNFGIQPNLWLIANIAEVAELAIRGDATNTKNELQAFGWEGIHKLSKTDSKSLEAIKKRCRKAAAALQIMEQTNKKIAGQAQALPVDRTELVTYGGISIVSLAGYTGDFQATIYSIIAQDLFQARVSGELKLPVLLLLEEAHNFAPGSARTSAEQGAVTITRQIAQEGRKFNVGLIIISQRPSRLDETTLSQCNSYIIMRMVNPADQNFVRKVVESLGEEDARMLPDLDVGEALLSGQLTNFPVLVRIRKPQAQGEHEEEDAFVELEKMRQEQQSSPQTYQHNQPFPRGRSGR